MARLSGQADGKEEPFYYGAVTELLAVSSRGKTDELFDALALVTVSLATGNLTPHLEDGLSWLTTCLPVS